MSDTEKLAEGFQTSEMRVRVEEVIGFARDWGRTSAVPAHERLAKLHLGCLQESLADLVNAIDEYAKEYHFLHVNRETDETSI